MILTTSRAVPDMPLSDEPTTPVLTSSYRFVERDEVIPATLVENTLGISATTRRDGKPVDRSEKRNHDPLPRNFRTLCFTNERDHSLEILESIQFLSQIKVREFRFCFHLSDGSLNIFR
jgi:hypothetical protein